MIPTKQSACARTRACGPISLVKVLAGLGIERTLDQACQAVTRADPFGTRAARSYLIGAFARNCGLHAAVLQCRSNRAWQALQRCHALGLSVILNHQAIGARDEGHFTILTDISDEALMLDDPFRGPQMKLDRSLFLDLWDANTETIGHVMIAIGEPSPSPYQGQDSMIVCPGCNTPIDFQPQSLFRFDDWAEAGLWRGFFCLGCDASFSRQ